MTLNTSLFRKESRQKPGKGRGVMLEESAESREASGGGQGRGGRGKGAPRAHRANALFSPQGRKTESPAPLQTSPHPRWSQDEGLCPHDPLPGVLGGGQALRPSASPRQHDHRERQDQHHGKASELGPGTPWSWVKAGPPTGISCQNNFCLSRGKLSIFYEVFASYKQPSAHRWAPTLPG